MITTTRWKNCNNNDIDTTLQLFTSPKEDDMKGVGVTRINWKSEIVFDKNKTITLFEHDVIYNIVKFSYDKLISYGQHIESTTPQKGFIIIYSYNDTLNYIIDKNTDALKILRKFLSCNGKKEIINNSLDLSNDFFIWLIYRVYNSNNNIELLENSELNLMLQSIKGFSGDTEDLQTKVSASGESVMNIISTLSFFLESRQFKQIKLCLNPTLSSKIF